MYYMYIWLSMMVHCLFIEALELCYNSALCDLELYDLGSTRTIFNTMVLLSIEQDDSLIVYILNANEIVTQTAM